RLLGALFERSLAGKDTHTDAGAECAQRSLHARIRAGCPRRSARERGPRISLIQMNVAAEIFRAYDIRGIAGTVLTAAVVREIGRAIGSLGRERGSSVFAVGRDGRQIGRAS